MDNAHTVLVVDDEPANLRMMERLLRRQYRVLTANGGLEAMEILEHEKVSLLMTDHRMPGMTGLELLMRSKELDADMARIMVTANTDNEISMEAINTAGVLRVIHKPWDPDRVLQFVQEALNRRDTLVKCKEINAEIDKSMNELRIATESLNLFPVL